jgi:hypothetical protein
MADDSGSPPLDVRLEALQGAVEDVREEVHGSLAEVRQLVEQSRQAVFRMENMLATSDPGASLRVAERVDTVRAIAERTRRRQGLLIGVVVAQAVMLAVAIVFLFLMRADVQREAAEQASLGGDQQTLSAVDPGLAGDDNNGSDTGKRRRLNRRHR